jgi:hypothetical protein
MERIVAKRRPQTMAVAKLPQKRRQLANMVMSDVVDVELVLEVLW